MIKVIDKVCEILYGHVPIFNTLIVYDAREDGTTVEEYQDKRTSCYGEWKRCQHDIYLNTHLAGYIGCV